MEEHFTIPTDDEHLIYATLNYKESKSQKLVIFVHGLTGNQNEHLFYNGAKYFTNEGFAVLRFDLYSGEPKGRTLTHTTIETHSKDLTTVLNHIRGQYKEIHLIGHSLGSPTILGADLNSVTSVVVWDPSIALFALTDNHVTYVKELDMYTLNWEATYLVSKEVVASWKAFHQKEITIDKPVKIIFAENGDLKDQWRPNLDTIEHTTIPNATHCFDEEGAEEQLFEQTLSWITKHAP